MAEQQEGWPLGLQPLNMRGGGLMRNHNNFSGSISFNTQLSGTPTSSSPSSSSDSSSNLDTESTGSFFHDRSITLGSLIGVSRVVEISRRSARGRSRPDHHQTSALSNNKTYNKSKTWCFSLCPRDNTEVKIANNNTIPLGHFLAVERRAATEHRRSHSPLLYGPDELSMAQAYRETNSLFVNGRIAPPLPAPRSSSSPYSNSETSEIRSEGGNDYAAPMLFPCICGHYST